MNSKLCQSIDTWKPLLSGDAEVFVLDIRFTIPWPVHNAVELVHAQHFLLARGTIKPEPGIVA
jgi:hypothetical protein